jgi:LPS export ABC transporter protein LptC
MKAKTLGLLYMPLFYSSILFLFSCENSLKDIKNITSKESEKPVSKSIDVEIIYSDSTKVKAKLTAPLMIDFQDANKPYKEMPKGVKIIFYDDNLGAKGTITANYGIYLEKEQIIEFRNNVVAVNAQGETFKSEELIDNRSTTKLYSSKPVQITMTNGDVMNGTGFNSTETLYPWNIDKSTGVFRVTEKQNLLNQ